MSDSFRNRLKRLHEAHQRGRDSTDGPSGVYTADGDQAEQEEPAAPSGYGWERLGAVRCDDYGEPLWIATDRVDGTIAHGDWTLQQCREVEHNRLAMLDSDMPDSLERKDLLYMDTETTGLGPGALVFMVGIGFWDGDDFVVEQLLLDDENDEPGILRAFSERIANYDILVTFNGKRFDVPLMKKRYEEYGLTHPFKGKHHLDVLPLARRVFPGFNQYRLVNLEREILHFERIDDVPGKDIPPRWWRFQKNRNAELMRGVLEHNRHDVISMEALVATAINGGCPEPKASVEESDWKWGARRLGIKNLMVKDGTKAQGQNESGGRKSSENQTPPPGGVAEKLERTYRLRGLFARRDKEGDGARRMSVDEMASHVETTEFEAPFPDVSVPADEPKHQGEKQQTDRMWKPSPDQSEAMPESVARRVEELRQVCRGLIAQDMWREVFPMLCEIVALAPGDRWSIELLASYYRRDGKVELARALEERRITE